jgi:type I restriction enzyme S subunit
VRLRFLYFYLQTIDISSFVTGGTQLKLNQGNLNRITVPIPNDADQERIVEILDKFDGLINDISIGLPAELNARRRQYEYYRDKLLTFPKVSE